MSMTEPGTPNPLHGARKMKHVPHSINRAMTVSAILFMVSAFSGSGALAAGIPASIVVHTVTGIPVSVPRNLDAITTVIYLDRVMAIEAALAEGLDRLPEDHREATANKRLSRVLQLELKKTWEALFRILQDRITHLPAIVFDDQAVWYGSDLRRAVTRYRNLKNAEGGS